MKLDILAFGAHPDDVELGAAATIAKEISLGKKVGIIDLTQGELGTRGSKELRKVEASNAAAILGVTVRENLKFADGFFINDKEHQLEVIKSIRKYKPEIVLCNAVDDRHIDHPKASQLVSSSCFLSGLTKINTKLDGSNVFQEEWRPKFIYHYLQWKNISPDVCVDISDFMPIKLKAVMAYESQFFKEGINMKNTPISTKNFIDSVEYRARDLGRLCGVNYAEGFTVERCPLVNSIFDLK